MHGGVAVIDITPPAGLPMSGFAARHEPAVDAHDPLSVRALVLDDMALVACDVIGLHEAMSARIRSNACLPSDNILLCASHTHGGPVSMDARLGQPACPQFIERLESACIEAIALAHASRRPCRLLAGVGGGVGVATNRRQADGPVDDRVPMLQLIDEHERVFAVLVSHACHPVVLGADNRRYTADYPHFFRRHLEAGLPGCTAVFALGACGDVNSGHRAADSLSLASQARRSFAEAERIGRLLAESALQARMRPLTGDGHTDALASRGEVLEELTPHVDNCCVALPLAWREQASPDQLAQQWRAQLRTLPPEDNATRSVRASLLQCWINWADRQADDTAQAWGARVSLLRIADLFLLLLPGEQFAEVALDWQQEIARRHGPGAIAMVISCAEGNPGYICPDAALAEGGYEADEAHRYYGMPAAFAPGSVRRLMHAANVLLNRQANEDALDTQPVA